MNKLDESIRNNAIWCDTVSRSQGADGQFDESIWFAKDPTPRFFPNVITLSVDRQSEQMSCIKKLLTGGKLENWGVKDSFSILDLSAWGFRDVVNGEWIFRARGASTPRSGAKKICWKVLSSESDLITWESAWLGESASANTERTFHPSLLNDRRISFLGAYEDSEIVGGGIASRTGKVVGISNIFLRKKDEEDLRIQFIHEMVSRYPDTPLVGYESGSDLEAMMGIGFESIGPVRIWVRA